MVSHAEFVAKIRKQIFNPQTIDQFQNKKKKKKKKKVIYIYI